MPETKRKIPLRGELPVPMTWDLDPLYDSDAAWEGELEKVQELLEPLLALKGSLGSCGAALRAALEAEDELHRRVERLYTYAHLRNDQDLGNGTYQGMFDRIVSRHHDISAQLSWIDPEIMAIPDATMDRFLADPELEYHRVALKVLLRFKPHTLSDSEERIMAMAGEALGAPAKTFSRLNNADIRFPEVPDGKGGTVELSHANFVVLLENRDREVRRRAFETLYDTYEGLKNTLAATLDGAVKANVFRSRVRKYPGSLEASLLRDNVPRAVYDTLIDTIHDRLDVFHRYVDLRRRVLGLDTLDMYDMYVPLVPDVDLEVGWEQAREWVLESVAPLGAEYQEICRRAFEQRWLDVLECRGKRSGAYSSGCYDSYPYMLLNYQGTLDHVFTLAHELGHSMHSFLSNGNQGYRYAGYSIVVAEVASTTNEMLLTDTLLRTAKDSRFRRYLLNHVCDGFKGTVYRQVQFAEFERLVYRMAESGEPLTPETLIDRYYELNRSFYGAGVEPDRRIGLEWSRIPHFYYNFYVYKYATGFSAAVALSEGILAGDQEKTKAYTDFLKAGCSRDPLDILKAAGVDLSTPEPIIAGLRKLEATVEGLEGELIPA